MSQSAAGLFRATGGKRKARPQLLPDGSVGKSPDRLRQADDFEPTPPEPTLALCSYEAEALRRYDVIWEPACGDGRMMRDLESCGHAVVGSDLRDRGCGAVVRDFFSFTAADAPARCIVTNPPYNRINWRDGRGLWVVHALEQLDIEYMALLLNWSWPCPAGLAGIWKQHTPSVVYACRWKIDFSSEGAPPMYSGWFVWDRQRPAPAPGEARLRMMDRADARQVVLL